jgi:DNA-binding PucR family transcriptional regulator
MRLEEVRSILAGTRVDITAASSRLRYRLDAQHLGFVIWSDECDNAGGDASKLFGDMESCANDVAEALKASSSLALPIGRYFAGWATVREMPEPDVLPSTCPGLHVAVGRPGRGIEGFRRTHNEALEARRVATLFPRRSTRCTTFETVALDVLMTRDMDEARRFVASELGGLLDDSDATRRLAATLEVYLHEESSHVRAARRLGIHENTVAYRIKRAEELLGRKANERQLELRTALRLARFGPTPPAQSG